MGAEVGLSALAVLWTCCGFRMSPLPSCTSNKARTTLLILRGCRVCPRSFLLSGSVARQGALVCWPACTSQARELEEVTRYFC